MLRFAFLLVFLSWLSPASAAYAQLKPPPAFQSVGGVTTMEVRGAANATRYAGGYVMAEASLTVGARAISVPVAFRVAANAATFAVTKLNPWLTGLQIAAYAIPLVVQWITGSNSDLEIDDDGQLMVPEKPGVPGDSGVPNVQSDIDFDRTVLADGRTLSQAWADDLSSGYYGLNDPYHYPIKVVDGYDSMCACAAWNSNGSCSNKPAIKYLSQSGFGGVLTYHCIGSNPVVRASGTEPVPARHPTIDELGSLANGPINPALLPLLDIPIPVDPVPVINPVSEPVGDPLIGPNGNPAPELQPNPEPLRFPDGDPVPIPNTDPQEYSQPWYRVQPSPVPGNPWRVDVTQDTTTTTDPTPQPDPLPFPNPDPVPVPDFYTDCDKYPGSLGCMPVDSPPSEQIPSETRQITLQNGPSFNGGSCPANLNITVAGRVFTAVDMVQPCNWIANYVKPVLLLLAAISAVFIVMPRSEG